MQILMIGEHKHVERQRIRFGDCHHVFEKQVVSSNVYDYATRTRLTITIEQLRYYRCISDSRWKTDILKEIY